MRVHALKIFRNSLAMSVLSAVFSAIHLAPASLEITESYFFRPDRDRITDRTFDHSPSLWRHSL